MTTPPKESRNSSSTLNVGMSKSLVGSSNNNTFGVFDSLKNWQMTAPEGHVTVTPQSSGKETTVLTSEKSETLSNNRASPITLDSS